MIRAVMLFLLLLCCGCGRPDHWYVRERPAVDPLAPAAEQLQSAPVDAAADVAVLKQDSEGRYFISVEDAVFTALAHNRDLLMRRMDSEIARTFEQIERGRYDSELFISTSLSEARSSETDRGTGNQFQVNSDDAEIAIGMRQALPTGTELELDLAFVEETSDRTPDQSESRLGLTITQALLRGLGPPVNTARIQQAVIDAQISNFELRAFAESLVYETESTYWRLVAAKERIAALESALELAGQQRDEMKERIAVGVAAQNQMAASESELALNKQTLINASSRYQELQLRLLSLMQLPTTDLFDQRLITTTPAVTTPMSDGVLKDHVVLAMLKRPELGEARLRLSQRRLETTITKNGLLPRLDFFLQLGKTGFGANPSDAFNNMDDDTYDARIGIDFSYRLGDRSAAARHRAAFVGEDKAHVAIENLKQLVDLEVRLAWNERERARQQIAASQTTVSLQEETLRSEQERLKAGSGTSLLVAQAQRDLLQARFSFIQAISEYRIALISLYRAEGTLLERRGLVLGY